MDDTGHVARGSMNELQAHLLFDAKGRLSESPQWSSAEEALYWVDIENGLLHRFEWGPSAMNPCRCRRRSRWPSQGLRCWSPPATVFCASIGTRARRSGWPLSALDPSRAAFQRWKARSSGPAVAWHDGDRRTQSDRRTLPSRGPDARTGLHRRDRVDTASSGAAGHVLRGLRSFPRRRFRLRLRTRTARYRQPGPFSSSGRTLAHQTAWPSTSTAICGSPSSRAGAYRASRPTRATSARASTWMPPRYARAASPAPE